MKFQRNVFFLSRWFLLSFENLNFNLDSQLEIPIKSRRIPSQTNYVQPQKKTIYIYVYDKITIWQQTFREWSLIFHRIRFDRIVRAATAGCLFFRGNCLCCIGIGTWYGTLKFWRRWYCLFIMTIIFIEFIFIIGFLLILLIQFDGHIKTFE